MAGGGASLGYPKPDSERARRNAPTFEWVTLPARNESPVPPLPDLPERMSKSGRKMKPKWSKHAAEAWQRLWTTPQSSQWGPDFFSVCEQWLHLYEAFTGGNYIVSNAILRIEDKLGLNPKAMLQLRWRYPAGYVGTDSVPEAKPLAPVRSITSNRADPRLS